MRGRFSSARRGATLVADVQPVLGDTCAACGVLPSSLAAWIVVDPVHGQRVLCDDCTEDHWAQRSPILVDGSTAGDGGTTQRG